MLELLVRLNPASPPMTRTGSVPDMTTSDIAAACAGVDSLGLDILLVKCAGNTKINLFNRIYGIVLNTAIREKWKIRNKKKRLYHLTCLYILEYMTEPRCSLCHGTKFYKTKPCEPCKGTGYIRLNDAARAQAIDVGRSVWLRVWKSRYGGIIEKINMIESKATHTIKQNLYKNATKC